MYPLKLAPTYKDYIWGGAKLKTDFAKKTTLERLAESWELSCHSDGMSVILNGEDRGITLADFIKKHGEAVLGENCSRFDNFPVLIKLIDARENLSVQVHPDNDYALRVEGEYGKTEMWYIVDCDENSEILFGFKNQITPDEFRKRIENNTLLDIINRVKVKKGDVFFIKSGTLHAIGKGIVIAEIQQNSNITYRIYDYGRIGIDGNSRELHIDKAIEVTDLFPAKKSLPNKTECFNGWTNRLLSSCEYFTANLCEIETEAEFFCDEKSFHSLLVLSGNAELEYCGGKIHIKKGDSIFIPAKLGKYKVIGKTKIILTKI